MCKLYCCVMENVTASMVNVAKILCDNQRNLASLKCLMYLSCHVMSWSKKYWSKKFDVMSGHVLSRNVCHINDTVMWRVLCLHSPSSTSGWVPSGIDIAVPMSLYKKICRKLCGWWVVLCELDSLITQKGRIDLSGKLVEKWKAVLWRIYQVSNMRLEIIHVLLLGVNLLIFRRKDYLWCKSSEWPWLCQWFTAKASCINNFTVWLADQV